MAFMSVPPCAAMAARTIRAVGPLTAAARRYRAEDRVEQVAAQIRQSIVVENRPGPRHIGIRSVATSPPDGLTACSPTPPDRGFALHGRQRPLRSPSRISSRSRRLQQNCPMCWWLRRRRISAPSRLRRQREEEADHLRFGGRRHAGYLAMEKSASLRALGRFHPVPRRPRSA